MKRNINTFLFDLDGTLIDTAPDLLAVFHQFLEEEGLDFRIPLATFRPFVSRGSLSMMRLAYPDLDANVLLKKQHRFLKLYENKNQIHTALFDGVKEMITQLERERKNWGIVTNKLTRLTEPLLEKMALNPKVLVCGDTLLKRKPNPDPVIHAYKQLGVEPNDVVLIGDDKADVDAAKAANIHSVVVCYGYGSSEETWGADHVINRLSEVWNYYV